MKRLKSFAGPLAAFAAVSAAVFGVGGRLPGCTGAYPCVADWLGWQLASCYPGCFCEAFRSGGVVQPLSSYSNLFYFLAGLLILGARGLPAGKPPANRMTQNGGYAAGYGGAVVAIGAASLFFHVTLTRVGRWLDYMGMYAFTAYALVYGWARLRRWNDATFAAAYALLCAACGAMWFAAPPYRRTLLGGLIAGILAVEIAAHIIRRPLRIRTRWMAAALAVFFVAYAINISDENGFLCVPGSLWQWHVVWHFLTAVSTVLLFIYFRSEDDPRLSAAPA